MQRGNQRSQKQPAVEVVGTRRVRLTNQDKVLWLADQLTKGDLVRYYREVAAVILPHLRDRPLTLKLYPDGIDATPIFLQAVPRGKAARIKRWPPQPAARGDADGG